MIHGRYQAITASVVIHLLLAAILLYTSNKEAAKPTANNVTQIKSYLYKPAPPVKKTLTTTVNIKELENETITTPPLPAAKQAVLPENKTQAVEGLTSPSQPNWKNKTVITNANNHKSIGIKERALKQLDALNNQITQQVISNELAEHFRHKSPSVMHGTPAAAPKSVVPLSREQKHNKATQKLDGSLAITKGDNGHCTIEEDLSKVGIEGVKAYSSFNCGESKFDKSFRLHMEKIRKKIGK